MSSNTICALKTDIINSLYTLSLANEMHGYPLHLIWPPQKIMPHTVGIPNYNIE